MTPPQYIRALHHSKSFWLGKINFWKLFACRKVLNNTNDQQQKQVFWNGTPLLTNNPQWRIIPVEYCLTLTLVKDKFNTLSRLLLEEEDKTVFCSSLRRPNNTWKRSTCIYVFSFPAEKREVGKTVLEERLTQVFPLQRWQKYVS